MAIHYNCYFLFFIFSFFVGAQAVTIQSGPFRAFPCYATELANINYERANLLADFTGWMVKNNAAQYAAALAAVIVPSPPPTPNPSASTSKSSDKLSEAELIIIVCCSAFGFVLLLVGVFYYFVVVARSAMPPMAATDATAHMGGHADIEMNGN